MFQERLWEIVGLSFLKDLDKTGNLRRGPRPAYAEPSAFGGLEVRGARLLLFNHSFERTQEREFFVGDKLIAFFRRLLLKARNVRHAVLVVVILFAYDIRHI